ncbi:MAG TPA: hypothetical protein VN372_07585 [Methanospirillum sp.]|nr:hypothetical protein [Methanospirillum sp.]
MRTESISLTSDDFLSWTLRKPVQSLAVPHLAILCGDWSFGLLPYCGPGRVDDLWESERSFLDLFSQYLTRQGFFTLSLSLPDGSHAYPGDLVLANLAGVGGLFSALKGLDSPITWNPSQMICIGHGLGGYVLCQLAAYGIRPAAFIFAGGVYSDYEVILSQKYLPLIQMECDTTDNDGFTSLDSESVLIAKSLGVIFHAARKGRTRIHINNGNMPLYIPIYPMIFTGIEMPRCMFRYVTSPTFIIHGSADYDVSLWNAASIEQSVRQKVLTPERLILPDLDHWFRPVPKKPGDQIRERLNGKCFNHETDPRIFIESVSFINRILTLGGKG